MYEQSLLQELKDLAESFSDTPEENSGGPAQPTSSQPSNQVKIKLCRSQQQWHLEKTTAPEKDRDSCEPSVLEASEDRFSKENCSSETVASRQVRTLEDNSPLEEPVQESNCPVVTSSESPAQDKSTNQIEIKQEPSAENRPGVNPAQSCSLVGRPLSEVLTSGGNPSEDSEGVPPEEKSEESPQASPEKLSKQDESALESTSHRDWVPGESPNQEGSSEDFFPEAFVDQVEIKEEPDEIHIEDTLPDSSDDERMYEANGGYGMGK